MLKEIEVAHFLLTWAPRKAYQFIFVGKIFCLWAELTLDCWIRRQMLSQWLASLDYIYFRGYPLMTSLISCLKRSILGRDQTKVPSEKILRSKCFSTVLAGPGLFRELFIHDQASGMTCHSTDFSEVLLPFFFAATGPSKSEWPAQKEVLIT